MTSLQLSIVHRLPQNYRWSAGFAGSKVGPIPQNGPCGDNNPVALRLLSPDGDSVWSVIHKLSQALGDIEIPCSVLECEGEPCLFVNRRDEFTTTCQLENFSVAITEPSSNYNSFQASAQRQQLTRMLLLRCGKRVCAQSLFHYFPLSQYDNLMT